MAVQVQAIFKKDQKHLDGLDDVRKELIDKPLTPRVVVGVIDVARITHDVLDGSDTPTVRLRQVEVLDGGDAIAAINLLNRRYGARTGREDSQATLFEDWPGPDGPTELDEQAAEAVERLDARRAAEAPFVDSDTDAGEGLGADLDRHHDDDAADSAPWPDAADSAPWPGDVEFTPPPGDDTDDDGSSTPPARRRRK